MEFCDYLNGLFHELKENKENGIDRTQEVLDWITKSS